MTQRVFRIFALATSALLFAGTAHAKVGDGAWAQCVWDSAPQSAAKWLNLPVPTWKSEELGANVLLGHRLIALCDATPADPKRTNRTPAWSSVAATLSRSRPKGDLPLAKQSQVEALLCETRIAGDTFVFLYDVVRRAGGADTIVSQTYYGQIQGQAMKLPQDLRMLPKEGQKIERTCRIIGAEGELTDA